LAWGGIGLQEKASTLSSLGPKGAAVDAEVTPLYQETEHRLKRWWAEKAGPLYSKSAQIAVGDVSL
jgi:hypothetical protein